ncbi:hypothetical protein HJFPF1_00250 [Paramyrothecium foliicola]|nr:hypothetical protein HJFPF1_00250 [Paramyrothecium foliicola]
MSIPYLPPEINLLVLQALLEDGCKLASFATVSRQWQKKIEQRIFTVVKVTPSRIADLDSMTTRNRSHVRCIWFCLELEQYDCPACNPETDIVLSTSEHDDTVIMAAIKDLFSTLSDWTPNGSLTLDISVYSTSDAEHWFSYLTFEPDLTASESKQRFERMELARAGSDQHPWDGDSQRPFPPQAAIFKVFSHIMVNEFLFDDDGQEVEWWLQLPRVPSVTHLLIRQQSRRSWSNIALEGMVSCLSGLRELHYECWREWDDGLQEDKDECYLQLFESPTLKRLRRLTIFENFNRRYNPAFFPEDFSPVRVPNPSLSRALSMASINLESFSGSFMIDASHFFNYKRIEPLPRWPNLTTLVLTSNLLAPDKPDLSTMTMLKEAGLAALNMPRLKTMEIWNGREQLAGHFKFELVKSQPSTITWKSTWELTLPSFVTQAWEDVVNRRSSYGLTVLYHKLEGGSIMSHGDAMSILELPELVVRPVSLEQIRREQSFGWI